MRVAIAALAVIALVVAFDVVGLLGGGDDEDTTTEGTAPPKATLPPVPPDTEGVTLDPDTGLLSPATTAEAKAPRETPARPVKHKAPVVLDDDPDLSRRQVQKLKRAANDWASLFATDACNKYMGQPQCERLGVPVSAAFKKSFADATVEEIKSERTLRVRWTNRPYYEAAVKFSNGVVVVFGGVPGKPPARSCAGAGSGCVWNVAEPNHNRRFFAAAGQSG
jgi:hypothetical protein